MNRNSTSRASRTDWDYVAALQDEDIDLSDIPKVTAEQMARARLRVGGQPVPLCVVSFVRSWRCEVMQQVGEANR